MPLYKKSKLTFNGTFTTHLSWMVYLKSGRRIGSTFNVIIGRSGSVETEASESGSTSPHAMQLGKQFAEPPRQSPPSFMELQSLLNAHTAHCLTHWHCSICLSKFFMSLPTSILMWYSWILKKARTTATTSFLKTLQSFQCLKLCLSKGKSYCRFSSSRIH